LAVRLCKECVLRLRPYVPGKPIEEVQREYGLTDIIKLASNENPLGPSPKAVEAMKEAVEKVGLYPDGNCFALRRAVAAHLGVQPENLTFGAGSDELIHEIGVSMMESGDEIIQADPTFSQYETAAVVNDCLCCKVPLAGHRHDLEAMARLINEHTKFIFIANPNNPTGTLVGHDEVKKLLDKLPERVMLVLDEAYFEYNERDDYPRGLEWVNEGRNVIILRTFSKIYGLAGLRLGYAVAKPELIANLEQVRLPFNINSVAMAGAIASLEDQDHIERSRALNAQGKRYFYQEFDRLGLPWVPSEANFVWVDLKKDSKWVFTELLKRGVIIRTGDVFGAPTYARITIGTPEENLRFISALEEVLGRVASHEL
jgi:histidinol-phosphate aminotransferase